MSQSAEQNGNGATDLTDGNKAEPGTIGTTSGRQGGTGLDAVGDQVGAVVQGFGDAVKNLTGLGRSDADADESGGDGSDAGTASSGD